MIGHTTRTDNPTSPYWELADRLIAHKHEYRARRGRPCPICGKPDSCVWNDQAALCARSDGTGSPRRYGQYGYLHVLDGSADLPPVRTTTPKPPRRSPDEQHRLLHPLAVQATRGVDLRPLAKEWGVSVETLQKLGIGRITLWGKSWWTIPERDPSGHTIGIALRGVANGKDKRQVPGSWRGLTYCDTWDRGGPIQTVEGPSDTAAAIEMGLSVIGRPPNTGGAKMLIEMLEGLDPGRQIVIVGENDQKPDGTWPGRDGARSLRLDLIEALADVSIEVYMPAKGSKDTRSWYQDQVGTPAERGKRLLRLIQGVDSPRKTRVSEQNVGFGDIEETTYVAKADKTPESIAARLLHDHPDLPCGHVKRKWMEPRAFPGHLTPIAFTCKKCLDCQETKENRRLRAILYGIRLLGGDWYVEKICRDGLEARGKYVKRQGGTFKTIRQKSGHIMVANRPISKGSEPVENVEEIAICAVEDAPHDKSKVIGGARTWPKMEGKRIADYIDHKLPTCKASLAQILQAADRASKKVEGRCVVGPFKDVEEMRAFTDDAESISLLRPVGFDREMIQHDTQPQYDEEIPIGQTAA